MDSLLLSRGRDAFALFGFWGRGLARWITTVPTGLLSMGLLCDAFWASLRALPSLPRMTHLSGDQKPQTSTPRGWLNKSFPTAGHFFLPAEIRLQWLQTATVSDRQRRGDGTADSVSGRGRTTPRWNSPIGLWILVLLPNTSLYEFFSEPVFLIF